MQGSTKRLVISLGSLIFITGSIYVFAALINPAFGEIQELRGEKQAIMTLLTDYEEAIEAANSVLSRHKGLANLQNTFSAVIPLEASIPSLLNQLYGLASLSGVTVDAITFQELPIQTARENSLVRPYGTIQATIKCVSNYESMKKYLGALETNARLMNITAINITGGFEANPILSYNITIEAYYQIQ